MPKLYAIIIGMQPQVISRRGTPAPSSGGGPGGGLMLLWRGVAALIFVLFLAGGLLSAYLFYETVRGVVAGIPIQAKTDKTSGSPFTLPGAAAPIDTGQSAPAAVLPGQSPVTVNPLQRVNVLLLGVDARPGETGPTRTDTMIVVSLDPATKSVAMLSIPRDLWVPIPGFGEDRINDAYFVGDWKKYPGGGPALAKRTIQYNFGIPIDYYVTINFVGFRQVVDAVGGVTIDVPKDINDPSYPDDTYGYRPLFIAKGVHHFNGDEALEYARTRHQDSDFGRMQRQQQVLKAIRDQALSLNIIPRLPSLWAAREGLVQTDLTLDKIVAYAQMSKDIKPENIRSGVIDQSMALGITTPSGAMVLWPDRERIRALIDDLFKPGEGEAVVLPTATPPGPSPALLEQMKKLTAESARIELLNGTSDETVTVRAATWLKAQGLNIVMAGQADRTDYPQTILIESRDKPYTRSLLISLLHVATNTRQNPNAKSDVDLRVVIGADFNAKDIPAPQQ